MKLWLFAVLWVSSLGFVAAQGDPGPTFLVQPKAGEYPSPLEITVTAPEGASVQYRFLESSSAQMFSWKGPLALDALPGERRSYTLRLTTNFPSGEALTRDVRYVVVGPRGAQPTIQPPPGTYTRPVIVQPHLPEGWTVALDGSPVSGTFLLDAVPGDRRIHVLDAHGPGDQTRRWVYAVDRRDQQTPTVTIVSPRPGTWGNSQPLVAVFQGVDQVLWSYGSHLDRSSARIYEGPTALGPEGGTVTVAGHSRVDGSWIEQTVTWKNDPVVDPGVSWPASGTVLQGLDLPGVPGWEVSWDDGLSWEPSVTARHEASSVISQKVLTAQLKKGDGRLRYVWWLDARPPQAPMVQFTGGWNPRLEFSGASLALHRVEWTRADGKTQIDPHPQWGPLGSWKVPDGVIAARVSAHGANGLDASPVTLGFPETGWSIPGWEPWDLTGPVTSSRVLPLGGRIPPRPGFRAAYEVSDNPDVPEPSNTSPWLDGAFLPRLPWGADRTFYARFAWRDEAGLTGPSSPVVAVRVNRVPPPVPEVQQVDGQMVVKASEGSPPGTQLLWAVTTQRVTSTDGLTFQPYQKPLGAPSLQFGNTSELWFHAEAQDLSGNLSPPRLNVAVSPPEVDPETARLVQVDPDPLVGELPVQDGGVYSWSQLRLRAVESEPRLWVGVADQAGVPADWEQHLESWDGPLLRTVAQGERRTFVVYWDAKGPEGWVWPQPKRVTVTLDRAPPAAPILDAAWPEGPLGLPWTLRMHPGQPGDHLLYSYTLDGSTPPDPLQGGQRWPGTRTFDAPGAGRVQVKVRVLAVSTSGLGVEMPLPGTVVVDRSVPAAEAPALEPFTYRSNPWVVPGPGTETSVRYSLTSDGSQPGIPAADSPEVGRGLSLEGIPGRSVLYRFRWRPFSATGVPGPVSDTYAVLVDRTASGGDGVVPQGVNPGGLRVSGVPESGVSAKPVTLEADAPKGTLHYELSEGVALPRAVTSSSPVWTNPLVLDGGAGIDRSYVVTLRAFGDDGFPTSEEVRFPIRVDRCPPLGPAFEVKADSHRPEATLSPSGSATTPDEVLHYRWIWTTFPTGAGESEWKVPGPEEPRFSAPEGKLTNLRVQAYLQDEAGNQGPTVEKSLLIDQNVVYLAPQASGDGTRLHPLGKVSDAISLARKEGKSFLLAAKGVYAVAQTLDLEGLQVLGGLAPDQWESGNRGRSLWTATAPFAGKTFLESGDRAWSLENVDLATGSVRLDRVVAVQGARVSIRNSSWTWSGAQKGWDQEGGTVEGTGIAATYGAEPGGTFLDLRSVETTLRGFTLDASGNQNGLLVSLNNTQGLFQDVTVVSKKALGFDGVWSAVGSHLTFDRVRILAGDGANRSTGFVFKQTEAELFNADISLYGSSANTGFQASGGKLEWQKTNVSLLRGSEFNNAVVLDHALATLRAFQVKIATGGYQTGFTVDGGTLTLGSGMVQVAGGGQQAWGAQFLSPCLVSIEDVHWILGTRTPGDVWSLSKPWLEGSSTRGSVATGW